MNRGGEIPKSYYFTNKPKSDIANKKAIALSHGSKERIEFQINDPYSLLRYGSRRPVLVIAHRLLITRLTLYRASWEFYSEEGDVAFAVYRKTGNELTPLVPHDRVDCHISAEEGEIQCDAPGLCKCLVGSPFHYIKHNEFPILLHFFSSDVVEFDNSFSYIRSKKIWYAISVEKSKPLYEENGNDL